MPDTRPATLSAKPAAVVQARPWWREPMLWLVIGGPAAVVVASLATAVVAYVGADPLVNDLPTGQQVVRPHADTPAIQACNHAATAAAR